MAMISNTPGTNDNYTTVNAKEFSKDIQAPNIYLLDVRNDEEFAEGHIAGAHNIDVMKDSFDQLAQKELPTDKVIAVYCRSGKRSAIASEKLSNMGYPIINLDGGITAWQENGLPVVK